MKFSIMAMGFFLGLAPALAQEGLLNAAADGMDAEGLASTAQEAADTLAQAAKNRILIRDLFGAEITGPEGEAIGTVQNLAVIPGGQIVAALVEMDDGTRIAVPFKAVKVSRAAGKLSASLPVALSELEGMEALQSLARQMESN